MERRLGGRSTFLFAVCLIAAVGCLKVIEPCSALLFFALQTAASTAPARRRGTPAARWKRRFSSSQGPLVHGDVDHWSDATSQDKGAPRAGSLLQTEVAAATAAAAATFAAVTPNGVASVAALNENFKQAFANPLQVAKEATASLKQLQDGGEGCMFVSLLCMNTITFVVAFCCCCCCAACGTVLWGKAESLTKRKQRKGLAKSLNWFSSCSTSKFVLSDGGSTYTWKECASQVVGNLRFFSWVKPNGETKGVCTLIAVKEDVTVDTESLLNCLRDATEEEIAVSGAGVVEGCTSCRVSTWRETPCSTWCEAGVSGRYRSIEEYVGLEHCKNGEDKYCDKCPYLWDIEKCNQGVKCGKGIQPGRHYCPDVQSTKSKETETWRQCGEACLEEFKASGGNAEDPSTFGDASCFHYSFNNSTLACELKPLVACSNKLTTDASWLSGDILTSANEAPTTVAWSSWSSWSSCEGIDTEKGWKKRRRQVVSYGYRDDNLEAETKLIEADSCKEGGTVPSSELTQSISATCCILGEFIEWSAVACSPVCGSDRYQIRRRRRLQNPVPKVGGGEEEKDATCDEEKCKQEEEKAESRKCRDAPECTSDCVYLEWTDWSACTCTQEGGAQLGRQSRVRRSVGGTICPEMKETQACEATNCTEESSSMTYFYAAGGAMGGLFLLGGILLYRRMQRNRREATAYDTL